MHGVIRHCLMLAWAMSSAARAESACGLPVSGCVAPGWEAVEQSADTFFCDRGIPAGVVGVLHRGRVVYRRAFGWHDAAATQALQTDALLRMASLSKPFTAAAVRELIAAGQLSLDSRAFELGQAGGGVLTIAPFPGLGDNRLRDITVDHLLRHRGGWDRDVAGDLTYRELEIRSAMGLPQLPSRAETVAYILGQPLQFTPGSRSAYSNIGALVLALIVEARTGQPLVDVIQQRVLDPLGVPDPDHQAGRTFRAQQDPREPWYRDNGLAINVFDPSGPWVSLPYGAWNHEARVGQGGQIASIDTLLSFLRHRQVSGIAIGAARSTQELPSFRANHTGSLAGSDTLLRQRGDGYDYALLLAARPASGNSYASQWMGIMDGLINANSLPTQPGPDCDADGWSDGFEPR